MDTPSPAPGRVAVGRLHARLAAATHALSLCSGVERDLLSSTQADAVIELAKEAQVPTLSAELKAKLTDRILGVPWGSDDRVRVLNSVMFAYKPEPENPAKRERRLQQKYSLRCCHTSQRGSGSS